MKKKTRRKQRNAYRKAYQEASVRAEAARRNFDTMCSERDSLLATLDKIRTELAAARDFVRGAWENFSYATHQMRDALADENVHLRTIADDILGMIPWAEAESQDGGQTP